MVHPSTESDTFFSSGIKRVQMIIEFPDATPEQVVPFIDTHRKEIETLLQPLGKSNVTVVIDFHSQHLEESVSNDADIPAGPTPTMRSDVDDVDT